MSPEANVQDALSDAARIHALAYPDPDARQPARRPARAGQPPDEPSVVEFNGYKTIGKPGGELHMLVGRTKDTRLMVVYGYARLVAYDEELELVPDILKDVEVEDGRIFTLHLRKGHRWSDGEPLRGQQAAACCNGSMSCIVVMSKALICS